VGNAGGGGQYKDDSFVHKSLAIKEDLVKAKVGLALLTSHVLTMCVGLYKIFVYLFLCMQESIIPVLPPPICITLATAILLRDDCAIHDLPPIVPLYAKHHTKLVIRCVYW